MSWKLSPKGNLTFSHEGYVFTVFKKTNSWGVSHKVPEKGVFFWENNFATRDEAQLAVEQVLHEKYAVEIGYAAPLCPINFPPVRSGKNETLNQDYWPPVETHDVIVGSAGDFGKFRFSFAYAPSHRSDGERLAIDFAIEKCEMAEFRHVAHNRVFFVMGGATELRAFAEAFEKLAAEVRRAVNG